MIISSKKIMSVTEVSQNFKKATEHAKNHGETVIFKRNKPAFILLDIETMGEAFIYEYEKLKLRYISEEIMDEYDEAYQELAK